MSQILDDQSHLATLLNKSKLETRQLYQQIDKVKSKIKDTTLSQSSLSIPKISQLNLKTLQILKGHNNKISDFKWSFDSKSILSCSQDGFLLIWDPATGMKLDVVELDSQWVLSCAYSPDSKLVASAGLTNNCTIYKINGDFDEINFQQRIVSVFKGHSCGVNCCDFINDNLILTGSGDMTCLCWDIKKGKKSGSYLDHFGDVLSLDINRESVTNNEYTFVSGASDGYARVWDSRSGKCEQSFFVSNSDVTSVKYFKDGNSIVTGSDDGIIRLYDLRADCELSKFQLARSQQPQQYQYSPMGTEYEKRNSYNSSSSHNSAIENSGITSIDFSASGRLMFACYSEQGCLVWDTLKSELVGSLQGHSNRVCKVAAAPNGMGVATGSWDTTMRVWTPSYQ